MREGIIRKILDTLLDNYESRHHLDSYNHFVDKGITDTLNKINPILVKNEYDEKSKKYKYESKIFVGGKDGKSIYFSVPSLHIPGKEADILYPNKARLINESYSCVFSADIHIETIIHKDSGPEKDIQVLEKQILNRRFPIMLKSKLCALAGTNSRELLFHGECANEKGGYFIIDGNEKVLVSIEKAGFNIPVISKPRSEDISTFLSVTTTDKNEIIKRKLQMKITPEDNTKAALPKGILASMGLFRKDIPIFVLFRALGITSDEEIINVIFGTTDKTRLYQFTNLIYNCARASENIYDQETALKYMSTFLKQKALMRVLYYLNNDFLVNIEGTLREKAMYLGYLVRKLIMVEYNLEQPTDKDDFRFKRVFSGGSLLQDLFVEYYEKFTSNVMRKMTEIYNYNKKAYEDDLYRNILTDNNNSQVIFSSSVIEDGLLKGLKGSWGSKESTRIEGVAQELSRLSYFDAISHLRRCVNPMDSSVKLSKPRMLHGSQYGYMCAYETPTGARIGIVKNLATTCFITPKIESDSLRSYLESQVESKITKYQEIHSNKFLVFLDGTPIGYKGDIIQFHRHMDQLRKSGSLSRYISLSLMFTNKEYHINSSSGRCVRPLFRVENKKLPISGVLRQKLMNEEYPVSLNELFYGTNQREDNRTLLSVEPGNTFGVLALIDPLETSTHMIAKNIREATDDSTMSEIHGSCVTGVLGSFIPFGAHNPGQRNLYSCGQSKAAVSIYATNFSQRFDTMAYLHHYPQKPMASSWYHRRFPGMNYGYNAMVAIATYSGYNQEDGVILNKTAIERGMYHNSYYKKYSDFEETDKKTGEYTKILNTFQLANIKGQTKGGIYEYLDENGIIREGTKIKENMVLIGKAVYVPGEDPRDVSLIAGRLDEGGVIDKVFTERDVNGNLLVKIRVIKLRIPELGDKFSSRAGQKGTIGMVIRQEDMPRTEDGLTPDIIVNPHALPSRMTIGQLVETLASKFGIVIGNVYDATIFDNQTPLLDAAEGLERMGYHKYGDEYLYNGQNGNMMETRIFYGPCYYMRLKHQVSDKINYRNKGPRVARTRQPVGGRSKGGGLRIGEMERDCLISHGTAVFLKEGMMERSDKYTTTICNNTGIIAAHNPKNNEYLSLMMNGPIEFDENLNRVEKPQKGFDFSKLEIPYAYKVFTHEVEGINNISMRLITSKHQERLAEPDFESYFAEESAEEGGEAEAEPEAEEPEGEEEVVLAGEGDNRDDENGEDNENQEDEGKEESQNNEETDNNEDDEEGKEETNENQEDEGKEENKEEENKDKDNKSPNTQNNEETDNDENKRKDKRQLIEDEINSLLGPSESNINMDIQTPLNIEVMDIGNVQTDRFFNVNGPQVQEIKIDETMNLNLEESANTAEDLNITKVDLNPLQMQLERHQSQITMQTQPTIEIKPSPSAPQPPQNGGQTKNITISMKALHPPNEKN